MACSKLHTVVDAWGLSNGAEYKIVCNKTPPDSRVSKHVLTSLYADVKLTTRSSDSPQARMVHLMDCGQDDAAKTRLALWLPEANDVSPCCWELLRENEAHVFVSFVVQMRTGQTL